MNRSTIRRNRILVALKDGETPEVGAIAHRSHTSVDETIDWLNSDPEMFSQFMQAHNVQALILMSELLAENCLLSDELERYLDQAW